MIYDLPTAVEIGGVEFAIRSDYRPALDIMLAMNDPELDDMQRTLAVLDIFYPDFDSIPLEHYKEAIEKVLWFIQCGDQNDNTKRKAPKLMDWDQDFQYIVAPINRVVGQEIRSIPYLHWWSFISAYYEIGDCYFAQVVRIRNKKAKGALKDKADKDFYKENRSVIDFKTHYTSAEEAFLKNWGGGGNAK